MNSQKQVIKYLVSDVVSAAFAWTAFYLYRKEVFETKKFGYSIAITFDTTFYLALFIIPAFWVFLNAIIGSYSSVFRRHRIMELGQCLLISFIGVTIIFFALLLDDVITSYKTYYESYIILFGLHFFSAVIPRYLLTATTVRRIHARKIGFRSLIVGGSQSAIEIYNEINEMRNSPGNLFVGYVSMNGTDQQLTALGLRHFGELAQLKSVIEDEQIEEVIVAVDSTEHKNIGKILNQLEDAKVQIKIIPDMYDIMSGTVKMTNIFGAPLIRVNPEIMSPWEFSLKRIFDLTASIFALVLLSPLYLILAILVKMSSTGPIFFKQERIGLYKKPFNIYKFRTMFVDSERDGPQLSSATDSRITSIGKFMRKTRLDELPQFFNVIKGDMSIVGPRPERQFFINKIVENAPHYVHLHKVKPGITSWGQVKYGYAENVDQMVQRLKFDLLYIENMSFALDIKILAYTVIIILKGSGK